MSHFGVESMSRYASPINPAIYPQMTIALMAIGVFFTAWFIVYEVTSTKKNRDLKKEFITSLIAAIFMGLGLLFLCLSVGIYV